MSGGAHLCKLDDVLDAVQPDEGLVIALLHHITSLQEALLIEQLCCGLHRGTHTHTIMLCQAVCTCTALLSHYSLLLH